MVEQAIFFGIGFLVAGLIGLVILPLVHNRAVRLTWRRLEAATPMSMAEIQAEKDHVRAEHAMAARRLEMTIEQLKARSTSQLGEIGRKTDAINRLKIELGGKAAAVLAAEAREAELRAQIQEDEKQATAQAQVLQATEGKLAEREEEIARLTAEIDERTVASDSQRVEIVALRTKADALRDQIEGIERDLKATQERLAHARQEAESTGRQLVDERNRTETLGRRIAELEGNLRGKTTEAESLADRVKELEARLTDQGRALLERDYDITQLRSETERAHRSEADLRTELAAVEIRRASAAETLKNETTRLEGELERAREERNRLQREVAAMKREAEESWMADRADSALLRERINDIAAEVAQLTSTLEGPGSPIEALLAAEAPAGRPGNGSAAPATLADRIRALKTKARPAAAS